jgi:chorismate synthase
MLRFLTSGESHGPALVAILDGVPAGLPVDIDAVNAELARRQKGYGRGARQKIETDTAELLGGVRHGVTSGAPISIMVRNRDHENWRHVMSITQIKADDPAVAEQIEKKKIGRFRPGHADLAGTLKFRQRDIRDVLERASARETAARVAVGAICEQILQQFGVTVVSHVIQVGSVKIDQQSEDLPMGDLASRVHGSEMFCIDEAAEGKMKDLIKESWQVGDTIGGVVEVVAEGLPVGLGSYTQWDEKLDGQLAQLVMSVHAIKAVEIGDGFENVNRPGSAVHDAIYPAGAGNSDKSGENAKQQLPFMRKTNKAGGLEGGMTNGSRIRVRGYMKPIPTLIKGLPSVSFPQFAAQQAHYERSDVCAVPAASVVVKAMVSFGLTRALLNKFGSDTVSDISIAIASYREFCRDAPARFAATLATDATPDMELE